MSSKRRLRRQSCGSKIKYETSIDGEKAIYELRRKNKITSFVNCYKCKFCKKYHIGRSNKTKINF